MSRVRSKDTSPEMRVRRVAHALGLRFRLHREDLPGQPDLAFPRHCVVIFVHGCFWHQHPGCKKASVPKSRHEFWQAKFDANVRRDVWTVEELRRRGWRVETLWECETKNDLEIRAKLASVFGLGLSGN